GAGIEGSGFRRWQLAGQRLEPRPRAVKAKIIEVDVAPTAGGLIDDANEDSATLDRLQIDDHGAQVLLVLARRAVEDAVVVGGDDIDACLPAAATADKETGVRMRDFEGGAGERALRQIAELFVAADPELAGVLGLLSICGPQLRDVAFNG